MPSSTIFTIFLLTVNHFYSTFASPTASKGDFAGQSLDLVHPLAKRIVTPPDQMCDDEDDWVSRTCLTTQSDREWQDYCIDEYGDKSWHKESCPENTMCFNAIGPGPSHIKIIVCLDRPSDNTVINTGQNQKGQMGVYTVTAPTTLGPVERTVSVKLSNSLLAASVAGFLEGMY
jgi:hypothetical protein